MEATLKQLVQLFAELDQWWQAHEPEFYQKLNSGVTQEELDTAEKRLGFALPADFRALYRWHNGQSESQWKSGLTRSIWLSDWNTLDEVLKEWDSLNTIFANHDFSDLIPEFQDGKNWWSPDWLPFLDYGSGDTLCLDMKGFFGGKPGQIIRFIHDDESRTIEYANLYHWLLTTVRLLQTEELYDPEWGVDTDAPEATRLVKKLNPGYPWFFPHIEGFPPQS